MSDLLSQFGRQPQTLLTNIGQGVRGLGGQLIQAEKGRRNQADYDTAEAAWDKDPTKENLRNVYKAAQVLGTLDQTVQTIEAMDTLTQKNRLTRNGQLLASYESGNTQETLRLLAEEKEALIAEGEEAEAKGLQNSIDMINNGEGDIFAKNLKITTGILTGGQDLLETMQGLGKEEREEGEFAIKIMESGAALNWDQATIDAGREVASTDEDYGETITSVLNYATALEGGMGLDPKEFNKSITGLRGEWMKYTEGFQKATVSYDKVNTAISSALDAGVTEQAGLSDLAGLTAFQRMIDDGIVRAEDVNNIKGANSFLDTIGVTIEGWKKGDILSDPQRREMIRLAEEYQLAQKKYVDEFAYPPLKAAHDRLDKSGETYKEVFGDYGAPEDIEKSFWAVGNVNDDPSVIDKEEGPDDPATLASAKEYFRATAQASLNARDGKWSKAELDKINDPNTSLAELEKMGKKTWDAFKAGNVSSGATNLNIIPIPKGEDMSTWGEDVNNG